MHVAAPVASHPPLGSLCDSVCYHCLRWLPPAEGPAPHASSGRRFCSAACLQCAQACTRVVNSPPAPSIALPASPPRPPTRRRAATCPWRTAWAKATLRSAPKPRRATSLCFPSSPPAWPRTRRRGRPATTRWSGSASRAAWWRIRRRPGRRGSKPCAPRTTLPASPRPVRPQPAFPHPPPPAQASAVPQSPGGRAAELAADAATPPPPICAVLTEAWYIGTLSRLHLNSFRVDVPRPLSAGDWANLSAAVASARAWRPHALWRPSRRCSASVRLLVRRAAPAWRRWQRHRGVRPFVALQPRLRPERRRSLGAWGLPHDVDRAVRHTSWQGAEHHVH